ncbi:MAG: hypothetical protein AB7F65_00645 [Dehalococcoidia bacterium]
MRLTLDAYRRGLIAWDPPGTAEFQIELTRSSGLVTLTTLSDAEGSVLPSGGTSRIGFKVLPEAAARHLSRVRWINLVGTRIWNRGFGGDPDTTLVRIPNYGYFHRLVVDAGLIDWPEDSVLRVGDATVIFINGEVKGEEVRAIEDVEATDSGYALTGLIASATAEGRMIEVVAPGASPEDAEVHARATLGLIELVLGEAAVRSVKFDEAYEGLPTEQRYVARLPVSAKAPRRISDDEIDHIHDLLPSLFEDEATSLLRALHWYQRGLEAATDEEALTAFLVGVETLANTHEPHSEGARKLREQRAEQIGRVWEVLLQELGKEAATRLRDEFPRLSLAERVRAFAKDHGVPAEAISEFGALNAARNNMLHGRLAAADEQQAFEAEKLLTALLRGRLGVTSGFQWENAPRVVGKAAIHMTVSPDWGDDGDTSES